MSKIIVFDPRRFRFDKSCRTNEGQRAFMTTALGNAEVWEIGGFDRYRTQLVSKMKLQRFTDHIFRFAMTGGLREDGSEVTLVNIYPENRWEDRMTFALDKSRFEPVLSKRDRTDLLRVFELPFNTENSEEWSIAIVQERAPARFFAPGEKSDYAALPDLTYEQWQAENRKKHWSFGRETKDPIFGSVDLSNTFIGGNALKKLLDMAKQGFDVERLIEKARQGFDIDNIIEQVKQEIDPDGSLFGEQSFKPDYVDADCDPAQRFSMGREGAILDHADGEFDENGLAERLAEVGNNCAVSFKRIAVRPSADHSVVMIGSPTSGSEILFEDATMTAYGLSMVLAKVGNGCLVRFVNVKISPDGLEEMICGGTSCSGVKLELTGVTLPRQALDLIYSKMDDSCNIAVKDLSTCGAASDKGSKDEGSWRETPKTAPTPKDRQKRSSGGEYYFKDMLKSTFENAAEGFNTFGEMMRKAEEDFTDMVDELIGGKEDKPQTPKQPDPPEEEKDDPEDTDE